MQKLLLLAVATVVACVHTAGPSEPTGAERVLAERMEAIAYHGHPGGSVGTVDVERTEAGAVRASRGAQPGRSSGDRDLVTEHAIRGKLSIDPLLATTALDVDVDGGIVRLSGELAGPEQAARAVSIALDEPGVSAVESRCTWIPEEDQIRLVGRARARTY